AQPRPQRTLGGWFAQALDRHPLAAQHRGIGGVDGAPGRTQQRMQQRVVRHLPDGAIHRMAKRIEHLALQRIPGHGAAPPASVPVAIPRRLNHSSGLDSAYSTPATSSVLGGSITSAMITATAISRAKNGTFSGPRPPPLKLL